MCCGLAFPRIRVRLALSLRDDRLRLVMVGRPVPQKGWDYVAEALRRLESSRPDEAARVELAAVGGIGDWAAVLPQPDLSELPRP